MFDFEQHKRMFAVRRTHCGCVAVHYELGALPWVYGRQFLITRAFLTVRLKCKMSQCKQNISHSKQYKSSNRISPNRKVLWVLVKSRITHRAIKRHPPFLDFSMQLRKPLVLFSVQLWHYFWSNIAAVYRGLFTQLLKAAILRQISSYYAWLQDFPLECVWPHPRQYF